MTNKFQFMVDFTLPKVLSDDFLETIPRQKEAVKRYFLKGVLVSYAFSKESSKLWAVFNACSYQEVKNLIYKLPLSKYMNANISPLTFQHTSTTYDMPVFSLN